MKYCRSFQTIDNSIPFGSLVIVRLKNNVGLNGLSDTQRLRMILYADDIVLLCESIDELAEIIKIYDKTFARFCLKISTGKTETMAFNVPEGIKTKPSLISIGAISLNNRNTFKYLGHTIVNNDKDPLSYFSHFICLPKMS